MAASGGGGAADSADLVWRYLLRAVEILTTFSKSDSAVKGGMAEDQCLKGEITEEMDGLVEDVCCYTRRLYEGRETSICTILYHVEAKGGISGSGKCKPCADAV